MFSDSNLVLCIDCIEIEVNSSHSQGIRSLDAASLFPLRSSDDERWHYPKYWLRLLAFFLIPENRCLKRFGFHLQFDGFQKAYFKMMAMYSDCYSCTNWALIIYCSKSRVKKAVGHNTVGWSFVECLPIFLLESLHFLPCSQKEKQCWHRCILDRNT